MATPPPPSPLPEKYTARLRVSTILLLFLAALLALFLPSASSISYTDKCGSFVPVSAPSAATIDPSFFTINNGFFSGADSFFGGGGGFRPSAFYFRPRFVHETESPSVLQVSAMLILRGGGEPRGVVHGRNLLFRPHFPRTFFFQRGRMTLDLSGYWSESTGNLCMVGTGSGQSVDGKSAVLSAVFKLNFPNVSTISSSLVTGSLESLATANSSYRFDPIWVLAYAQRNYKYTKISEAEKSLSQVKITEELLGLESGTLCSQLLALLAVPFDLDYTWNCPSGFCGPFGETLGLLPKLMALNQIQCSGNGSLHMYLAFFNVSNFLYQSVLKPQTALVGEGFWDQKRNRLGLVACHIRSSSGSFTDSSVDDCTIRMSLWFPAVWTIKSRSTAVGHIWSDHDKNDAGYFDIISFQSSQRNMYLPINVLPGCKYEYTKIDDAKKSCIADGPRGPGKKIYPNGNSSSDFILNVYVGKAGGNITWGYFMLVSIGDKIYRLAPAMFPANQVPSTTVKEMESNPQNISYEIRFQFPDSSLTRKEATIISAEGIYNSQTGLICLVGCRHLGSSVVTKQVKNGESLDCEIVINIQLAPLNPGAGERIRGSIRSTREKTDRLYFKPLEITSNAFSKEQAVASVWRMDMEIIMVLVSLCLSCIFCGLQLFHAKKYPEVLPSISITMLVILTLGYMIPLVLNFEALFFRNNRQNVFLWSGGWLEVNEVIVRITTMVAFLLQCRLLQIAWTVRSAEESKNNLWVAEKKALRICLLLYFAGGLIAFLVHMFSHQAPIKMPPSTAVHSHSLWGDLISYAGLILDGFLLPQFIFNILSSSKDKALAPSFYVGNTAVRALPHLYDAYRSHHYAYGIKSSFIYASPDEGFYSLVWDIIIPCGGVVLSVLIFLQQQFGGACLLVAKRNSSSAYEMVPVVST